MTRLRRLCASVVIFGVLAPSGASVAAAAHELLEHGSSFAAIDAISFAALVHGHRHAADAPDHDHTLVKPSSPGRVVDRGLALQSGFPSYTTVPAPRLVAVSLVFGGTALSTGSGPPPGISPLRV